MDTVMFKYEVKRVENESGTKGYANLSVLNNRPDVLGHVIFFFSLTISHPRGTNLDATLERKSSTNPSASPGGLTFTGVFKDIDGGGVFLSSFIMLIF